MTAWDLPTSVTVNGHELAIRSDYRAVLDAIAALQDPTLDNREKVIALVGILFPVCPSPEDLQQACTAALEFINLGEPVPEHQHKRPKLMDWEKDAGIIAPAVDRVLGYSCRRVEYLHWWEFIGAYNSITEGLFSQVVGIRKKYATHQKLDKWETEFARNNGDLIALPRPADDPDVADLIQELGV